MENHLYVYEYLLWDVSLMGKIDNCIKTSLKDGIINTNDIPYMVLLIVQILQSKILKKKQKTHKLTYEDTIHLFELFREYILTKIIIEFDVKEFTTMYNTCIKLAITTLHFHDNSKKWCL